MARSTDRPDMTLAVDCEHKKLNQTNKAKTRQNRFVSTQANRHNCFFAALIKESAEFLNPEF